MNTDVFCEIVCLSEDEIFAQAYLEKAFAMFRVFEQKYSRFIFENELWQLNNHEQITVSEELFDMLKIARIYYEKTNGLFDPSILPVMELSGYRGIYGDLVNVKRQWNFSHLNLDQDTLTVTKPKDMLIDIGGFGKGYIVDRVKTFLGNRFENVLVDAGGDIAVKGVNRKENYPYWVIEIEHPKFSNESVGMLLLKDMAVATSGRNRKRWKLNGEEKHHLINPFTETSASNDLLSVTVIASSAVEADIFAKALFIAGKNQGRILAETLRLPTVFIDKEGLVEYNHYMETYVWKS